jgi:type II secretory pathway component GspD/PulD (secretin)
MFVFLKGRGFRTLAFVGLVVATAAVGRAQDLNVQEEQLNFDRAIKESVDNFRILRTTEKSQMNDYVTRVFELKNAKCMEVVPYVNQAVRPEAGSARTLKYVDPETKRERNFIQVVAPRFQMAGIEQLIRAFDLPGVTSSPGDTRYFYRMQHRNAADVQTILQQSELSGEGGSAVDAPTNTLYFRDSASDWGRDLAVVRFMDVPVPQVELEVTIYELDRDHEDRLGLYWDAWKHSLTGGVFTYAGSEPNFPDGYRALLGVGGSAGAQFLNYLINRGCGEIVTSTRVSVQNGETATISSLKRIPYQDWTQLVTLQNLPLVGAADVLMKREQSNAPNAPGGQNQASSLDPGTLVGEKSEGAYVTITPTIGLKTLSAVTTVTVNSLVGFTKLDAPIIAERRTTTTATLRPGQVFMLGGMEKATVDEVERGVPGLRHIPLLGYLFKYETTVDRKTVLMITLRPTLRNQLTYKSLSLGWGTTPTTIRPDDQVFDQSQILSPNPDANTSWDVLLEGVDKEGPDLKWGPDKWRSP